MIRFRTVSLPALFWFATALAAASQTIDNGSEVQVNPMAGGSGQVLLYPGDQYMRRVPRLLDPGQTEGPIHLHMPTKHTAETRHPVHREAQTAAPSPKPARKPKVASAAPARQTQPTSSGYTPNYDYSGLPSGASNLFHYTGPSAPPSAPKAAPAPKTQVAKAEPAPRETKVPGLSKQSMILFAHDAADPADSALSNIKLLATQLNGAMTGPSSRVQILAYGGAKGDKGSDARRLSLKRALAIRQVLIDDGVPSERIDVRAMGGVDDSGPTDRVDVYVKA
jgi:outer membrane protein OmpA-like peptidoglycan-associated protein